jgi:hypothetical protein
VRYVLLDRLAHVHGGAEKPVGGHQPADASMRPLEVVAVDEKPDAPGAIGKIGENGPRQKLLPKRLPKSLRLAHRLRMLRPAFDVSYPLPPQLLLEFGLPAPRGVLPTLVGQYLLRHSVLGNAARKCLHYQFRPLMVRKRVRNDKPRMVVHENSHVEPLVPTKQKCENV